MAKYKVEQVNGNDGRTARRAVTVNEDRVEAARAWINNRTAKVPAESSDWPRVTKA
jgi:hypothetical protein